MYAFKFERPTTLRQAVNLLAKNEEGKLLAGGHSLIPVLKLRLASPSMLVDLSQVAGLSGIEVTPRAVVIGAMTRHADVANSKELQAAMPGLAAVPGSIGDPHVRNVGTIGGSLANNDPNADYPAAVLGLGATVITTKRRIPADEYFRGMFETALESDEIITKVSFPLVSKAGYAKFRNPASRYAMVGVFVAKRGSEIRVTVTGAGEGGVFRWPEAEAALKARFAPKSLDGLKHTAKGINGDIHADAEYRAHLIGVMAKQAVAQATGK